MPLHSCREQVSAAPGWVHYCVTAEQNPRGLSIFPLLVYRLVGCAACWSRVSCRVPLLSTGVNLSPSLGAKPTEAAGKVHMPWGLSQPCPIKAPSYQGWGAKLPDPQLRLPGSLVGVL